MLKINMKVEIFPLTRFEFPFSGAVNVSFDTHAVYSSV